MLMFIFVFSLINNYFYTEKNTHYNLDILNKTVIKHSIANYKDKVIDLANTFDLSPSFLMAVIALESSGRAKVPSRYEKKIYKKLLLLKKGKIKSFENIKQQDLKKISKKKLKKLACSYGPFQIMGYKCFFLNIPFDSLIGDRNMYYAVQWINITYGKSLRTNEYKDAFHMHNAGRKYPKNNKPTTHDPNYVNKGLSYEKAFRELM